MKITMTKHWARYAPGQVLPECNELLAKRLIAGGLAVEGERPKAFDEAKAKSTAEAKPAAPSAPAPVVVQRPKKV
jgi:hypothetical protein